MQLKAQVKHKESGRKEIMNIRGDFNGIEKQRKMREIRNTKSRLFGKTNKMGRGIKGRAQVRADIWSQKRGARGPEVRRTVGGRCVAEAERIKERSAVLNATVGFVDVAVPADLDQASPSGMPETNMGWSKDREVTTAT